MMLRWAVKIGFMWILVSQGFLLKDLKSLIPRWFKLNNMFNMFIPSWCDANTIFTKFTKEVAQSLASKKKLIKGLNVSTWKTVIRVSIWTLQGVPNGWQGVPLSNPLGFKHRLLEDDYNHIKSQESCERRWLKQNYRWREWVSSYTLIKRFVFCWCSFQIHINSFTFNQTKSKIHLKALK